ncbi:MAG: hypothetical protein EP330_24765 [Deltaproteobacteria bacterium]|nr:MAG: hypothetical protein EP330_24765 [Deltaproteobacteria bacterium]
MIAFLFAAALAASPGGIRVAPGVPTTMAGVRHVMVEFPEDDLHIHQSTLRLQTHPYPWGIDIELPVVVGWGGGWRDVGLGQWRFGARWWMGGKRAPVSVGIELAVPQPRNLRVHVWGSLARDTIPGVEMLVVGEGAAFPGRPLTWRIAAGFRQGPEWGAVFFPMPQFEVALAYVHPIAGPLSLGLEAEALIDPSAFTARPFVRADLGAWSIDALAQLPIDAWADGERTWQIGMQLRYFPPRPEVIDADEEPAE